jgi:putative endonuclease
MPGPEKTWHLYVLQCRDGTLYTGVTNDLQRRVAQHNAGKGAKYTRGRGPCTLVVSWDVGDKSTALRLEHRFKKLKRFQKFSCLSLDVVGVLCVLEP